MRQVLLQVKDISRRPETGPLQARYVESCAPRTNQSIARAFGSVHSVLHIMRNFVRNGRQHHDELEGQERRTYDL